MRPTENIAAAVLGPLETRVMETLWERGKSSVREVVSLLDGGRERSPAYTTVMTTLDRLFKKGMLERRVAGRGYSYWPRWTRQEWERKRAGDLVNGFLAGPQPASGSLLISCLVEAVGPGDMALLDELEEKIRMKREGAQAPQDIGTTNPSAGPGGETCAFSAKVHGPRRTVPNNSGTPRGAADSCARSSEAERNRP